MNLLLLIQSLLPVVGDVSRLIAGLISSGMDPAEARALVDEARRTFHDTNTKHIEALMDAIRTSPDGSITAEEAEALLREHGVR